MSKTIKPKESVLEKYLVKRCKEAGILCYKFSSPAQTGVPDRILIRDGQVLFLELKREGEVPTKLQMHHLKSILNTGVSAAWTDSKAGVDLVTQKTLLGYASQEVTVKPDDLKIITK